MFTTVAELTLISPSIPLTEQTEFWTKVAPEIVRFVNLSIPRSFAALEHRTRKPHSCFSSHFPTDVNHNLAMVLGVAWASVLPLVLTDILSCTLVALGPGVKCLLIS